uniref:Uncharacterized protein n=1 Tax=Candidatus Kentrum sp. MB TaxID=2138164 RepID=A0A450Y077_9GAMM|nr:MAG: hypothetical protein BECKMB1821G_GA0114241_10272 [Candidatus Kentron sp. MB]VFK34936.1 MAG: hypothetical protein BECKMB1821I_GA0114274_10922 [Candidatus Kentron sp. MB]VFK77074.1 MAG: hypothetical protein BECKMB1821H_GA0114242_10972 [Candidatus Kentron sp. MB]
MGTFRRDNSPRSKRANLIGKIKKTKRKQAIYEFTFKASGRNDQRSRKIGDWFAKGLASKPKMRRFTRPKKMREEVLSRMLDKRRGILKKDRSINSTYRRAWKGQDELFSTALTREFIKGIFEKKGYTSFSDQEHQLLEEMVDLASSVRIPTEFSGFSLSKEVLQHPANRDRAVFADPHDTVSLHSRMDTERRNYVESVMEDTIQKGVSPTRVMEEGVKAAIEYTLNYFTAPITASNVHPFSRKASVKKDNKILQEQIASRERIKSRYIELGGSLRSLQKKETQEESWSRPWNPPMRSRGFPTREPPSPRRKPFGVDKAEFELMSI